MTRIQFDNTPATYPMPAVVEPMPWMESAVCASVDPDLFHPSQRDPWTAKRAKSICAGCPVIDDCLTYGIADQHGIYGGLTARERRALPVERRQKLHDRAKEWGLVEGPESVPEGTCTRDGCRWAVAPGKDLCPRHWAVTLKRSSADHCIAGHLLDEANTYIAPGGQRRVCKTCRARLKRERRARLRAEGRAWS